MILFTYIYPGEAHRLPPEVIDDLVARWARRVEPAPAVRDVCRGGMLSRAQYMVDFADRGYRDERARRGNMTAEQLATWTDAAPDVPRAAPRRSEIRSVRPGGEHDADIPAPVSSGRAR